MAQIEKKWRVYAPEGVDTHQDVKAILRTMTNCAHLLGRGEIYAVLIGRDDSGDDTYVVRVADGERAAVLAREAGQLSRYDVFAEREEGIFICVSDKNYREAEGMLVKAFGHSPSPKKQDGVSVGNDCAKRDRRPERQFYAIEQDAREHRGLI